MSYILDALRRADAQRERERSAAPGLNAQAGAPHSVLEIDEAPAGPLRPARTMLVFAALFVTAGALAWWWLGASREEPIEVAATPATTPSAQSSGRQAPQPASTAEPSETIGTQLPSSMAAVPPPTATAGDGARSKTPAPSPLQTPKAAAGAEPAQEPARANPPEKRLPPTPSRERALAAPQPLPARPPAPAQATAKPVPQASTELPRAAPVAPVAPVAPAPRLPKVVELPANLRRELPPLAVAGSMYSKAPASRMVVVDGQVLREGQTLQPGLVLEEIGPKSAIFSIRGQRFELPF